MSNQPSESSASNIWSALSPRWTAALAVGVLIGAGGSWLGLETAWAVSLAAALVVGTTAVAVVRHLAHERTHRRQAALDAYIERELARTPARAAPNRARLAVAYTAIFDQL